MTTFIIILLSLFLITSIVLSFYLFKKLNSYIGTIEVLVSQNIVLTENLKQSLRDIMVDGMFLLDDGKVKPLPIQKEKPSILNGAILEEQQINL